MASGRDWNNRRDVWQAYIEARDRGDANAAREFAARA